VGKPFLGYGFKKFYLDSNFNREKTIYAVPSGQQNVGNSFLSENPHPATKSGKTISANQKSGKTASTNQKSGKTASTNQKSGKTVSTCQKSGLCREIIRRDNLNQAFMKSKT